MIGTWLLSGEGVWRLVHVGTPPDWETDHDVERSDRSQNVGPDLLVRVRRGTKCGCCVGAGEIVDPGVRSPVDGAAVRP